MHFMRTTTMALVLLGLGGGAWAQAKAEPDYSISFNAGAVTDYRYRGISQTRHRPALQGGADFAHASGFYLGAWASTIRWIKDAGGDAALEVDLYGGYKGSAGAVGYDVGVLRYQYPGQGLAVSPNTTELYAAGTLGPATLKYSHAVTNLFGFADSRNSYYVDASATFDLGHGFSLVPHAGYQHVRNNDAFSYSDFSLTLGKDFGHGWSGSLAAAGTDASHQHYVTPSGRFLGRAVLVLGAKYQF